MVITDCAAVLSTNPHHQKAIYRSARALQSLARPSEALSLVDTALAQDPEDVSLRSLQVSLQKALFRTEAAAQKRAAEVETRLAHRQALLQAIRMRGWRVILPDGMNGVVDPNLPAFELSEPLDPTSTVVLPLQLEYPLAGPPPVTELIRRCSELDTLGEQLAVVLDPGDRPGWDSRGEYVAGKVSCFLETKGRDGRPGLVRAGMKTRVGDLMAKGNEEEKDAEGEKGRGKGRVEVRGGMLRVLVLPRAKADGWVKEFGERIGALGGRLDR